MAKIKKGNERDQAIEAAIRKHQDRLATRERASQLLQHVSYDASKSNVMDWFFCEPQRNADYNSCNPCSLSSCEIEQPGALQAQDDSSKIQNSAAYFVRRGFDVPAANQRATPKTWNHDFTDFVRKE